jgi:hypothetical protein
LAITADPDGPMAERQPDDRTGFGWGLTGSLVLHALAALMLTGAISGYVTEPLQDTVEVELVAPPEVEEEAPAPQPDAAEAEEIPLPEEQQPEAATPPPAPPPAPEPPAETEIPSAETVPQPPVLQPVEQFGEEDTGPRGEAEDLPPVAAEPETAEAEPQDSGTALSEAEAEAGMADEGEDTVGDDPESRPEEDVEEADSAETETAAPDETADPAGTEAPADVGIAEDAPAEDFGVVGPIVTELTPTPKPARPAGGGQRQAAPAASSRQPAGPPAGMIAARELYSRNILDDPQARSAMRGMSEGQRLNLLCMTELRAQITAVSAFPPELLPSFRPPPGNVLQPRTAAFRSLGRWFDVSFRCETDSGVTRVETFAFRIGNEIPQSQWLERGLTGF